MLHVRRHGARRDAWPFPPITDRPNSIARPFHSGLVAGSSLAELTSCDNGATSHVTRRSRASTAIPMRSRDILLLTVLTALPRLFVLWALPLASGSSDPNCAPDELAHFWVVRDIALLKFTAWTPEGFSIYAAFPPVQYFMHALLYSLHPLSPSLLTRFASPHDVVVGYGYARLGGVVLGITTVLTLAQVVWRIERSRNAALFTGAFVALTPQLVFVNSYVNADSFTIAAGAVLTLAVVSWSEDPRAAVPTLWLGVALGIVLVGKPSGFFLLPSTLALIATYAREADGPVKTVGRLIVGTCVVAAPVLFWNACRNEGDAFGLIAYGDFLRHRWTRIPPPGPTPALTFIASLTMSTIGTFRNMDLRLSEQLYWIAGGAYIIGLGLSASAWPGASKRVRRLLGWVALSVAINVALVWWNSWFVDFQPQGRYILLSFLFLALVAGLCPLREHRSWRMAWMASYLAIQAILCVASLRLIYLTPCLPR